MEIIDKILITLDPDELAALLRFDPARAGFEIPLLRKNLKGANKIFLYIITVGPELERAASAQGDLLKQYYLEKMANFALESATSWLGEQSEVCYGVTGRANMSPGSLEDRPITERTKLFSIFSDAD